MAEQPRYPHQKLVPYDPRWPQRYAAHAADLHAALGGAGADWVIEHVGSTSVPGLAAKPVIDVAVRIPPDAGAGWHQRLVDAGWTRPRALGDHDATFWLVDGVRHGIAHLFTAAQWEQAHLRLFADWLRGHDEERDRYAALKSGLVAGGIWGNGYTDAKRAFVEEIVAKARAARGLNPVVDLR